MPADIYANVDAEGIELLHPSLSFLYIITSVTLCTNMYLCKDFAARVKEINLQCNVWTVVQ